MKLARNKWRRRVGLAALTLFGAACVAGPAAAAPRDRGIPPERTQGTTFVVCSYDATGVDVTRWGTYGLKRLGSTNLYRQATEAPGVEAGPAEKDKRVWRLLRHTRVALNPVDIELGTVEEVLFEAAPRVRAKAPDTVTCRVSSSGATNVYTFLPVNF